MGEMRFVPPPEERISRETWAQAYVSGLEGIPYPTAKKFTEVLLTVRREINESGTLYVPHQVEDIGEIYLCTASLMEREEPYLLLLELARGTVNRLRNQTVDWEMAGLRVAADLKAKVRHSAAVFARAAAVSESAPEQAQKLATDAIKFACYAIDRLGEEYGRQALAFRHQAAARLSTLLAGDLGMETPYEGESAKRFHEAFNAVSLPISWKQIEPESGEYDWSMLDAQMDWCSRENVRAVCLGPIFDPAPSLLPDWIYLWEDDFDQLQSRVSQFLQHVVLRYKGRVLLWHCAAGLNLPNGLALNEEQRLRLAVRAVEAVRQVDSSTPVVLSIDDPWGEYLTRNNFDLSPLHFADAMVRADLGLAGLGLRMAFGRPGGPASRDPLEVSQLIDRWGMLGLPLMLTTSIVGGPSRDGVVPASQFRSPQNQVEQARKILPILLAKQVVHGIIWGQLDDRQPHQPHCAGVFNDLSQPKPLLNLLADLRAEHLA